ncbi:M23 family metallopeptidase [Alkalimarinus alittae]|uniref:M23 family metallopeptidase n=1 Tax=Alkalimarinus alittae TaxID=2961619 RepID=A0ABY6MYC6_9ALTE|nr:M23 family metallopeptidase [Alkalimarinus alittae]UZE94810.1 M23 family metallopeptidase [Alkalimarinus alittae]
MMTKNSNSLSLFVAFALLMLSNAFAYGQIYKYKDEHGKWHFSDKKPSHTKAPVQQINLKPAVITEKTKPFLTVKQANGQLHYTAHNPLLIPAQCFLNDKETKKKISSAVIPPHSSKTVFKQQNSRNKRNVHFRYVLGDPTAQPDNALILPPFTNYKPMRVSQGFNGPFSHRSDSSRYAVDIGMLVGTNITAVREGVVIRTRDNYTLAGVSSPYFLDKANLVKILHSDGTYALYGHLLLGGVKVKVGDKVTAGQVIGLSGNTGYSTGPHLHFVMLYNNKGKKQSIPFKFLQPGNKQITPKRGDWLLPYLPN